MLSKEEQNIAENVKRLMEEHDPPLSIRSLESQADWTSGSLHKFLAGHHSPRFAAVWRLAQALRVSLDDLTRAPGKRARARASA